MLPVRFKFYDYHQHIFKEWSCLTASATNSSNGFLNELSAEVWKLVQRQYKDHEMFEHAFRLSMSFFCNMDGVLTRSEPSIEEKCK